MCFTAAVVALTSFTLLMQTSNISGIADAFDLVDVRDSRHEDEQRVFLLTLLVFPVLNLYLAVNIEVTASVVLPSRARH